MTTPKHQLRQQMKAVRNGLTADEVAMQSATIREQLFSLDVVDGAAHFFVYVAFRSEVETRQIIDCLREYGKTVVVPQVMDAKRMDLIVTEQRVIACREGQI